MLEDFTEDNLFYSEEAPACERAVMKPIHGTEAVNRIGRSNEESNFPVM